MQNKVLQRIIFINNDIEIEGNDKNSVGSFIAESDFLEEKCKK